MNKKNNTSFLFTKSFVLSRILFVVAYAIVFAIAFAIAFNTTKFLISNSYNKAVELTDTSMVINTANATSEKEKDATKGNKNSKDASKDTTKDIKETPDLLEYEKNTINVYQKNVASIVNITNFQLARNWHDLSTIEIPHGTGSGFVWNSDGYIVTNFHVIYGGGQFLVSFHQDKKQYKATVVGYSQRKDIAVLKLEQKPKNLTPVTVGISKNLMVGQKVMAIGNPFGLDHTLSTGIVSAIGRQIPGFAGVKIDGMIQTDASINPGNSGGPLLDSRGNLIGMNTAIFSKSGSSSGVGFAVPVDAINSMVPQLIKHGHEIRPGLGISPLEDRIKENLGINKGVVIQSVIAKSSADAKGLKGMRRDSFGNYFLGDIIVAIGDVEVNSLEDIYSVMEKHKVGDNVEVTILRDDTTKKVKITLMKLSD
ncbi:MAG: trypsin-like peptidase domain-containing protein [Oligoflexia bacterium]|nr:trypsin-like peptidase domain-containing protein [Oligoflexia bacterium]